MVASREVEMLERSRYEGLLLGRDVVLLRVEKSGVRERGLAF